MLSSTWATLTALSSSFFELAKLAACLELQPNLERATLPAADFVRRVPFRQAFKISCKGATTLLYLGSLDFSHCMAARYCCSSPAVLGVGTLEIAFVFSGSTDTPSPEMRQPWKVISFDHRMHFLGFRKTPKRYMRSKNSLRRSNKSFSVGACIRVSSKY